MSMYMDKIKCKKSKIFIWLSKTYDHLAHVIHLGWEYFLIYLLQHN